MIIFVAFEQNFHGMYQVTTNSISLISFEGAPLPIDIIHQSEDLDMTADIKWGILS